MNKKRWSFGLVILTILIFLVNTKHEIDLSLMVTEIKAKACFIYLGFTVLGIIIGGLFR